jgi:BMFP domain-containing protein YqiC
MNQSNDRPGLADLFERFMTEEAAVRGQIDKNARALAQSALARLDVVSRDEFDAQCAVLEKTQARVAELEAMLATLSDRVSAAEQGSTNKP